MERQGIRKHLWMTLDPSKPSRMLKSQENYVLFNEDFNKFCIRLESLKVPTGYYANTRQSIGERKLEALKTHDFHVLMQMLMPLALQGLMESNTRRVIMRVRQLFRRICYRTWDPQYEESLREDTIVTMALIEMTFPPTFFDVMLHLPMHLVEELIILSPVNVRW